MAFLLPLNIPSRSGVPDRLRQVARSLRDFTPESVTVWLRHSESGLPYLAVLDPSSGIAVIDAPQLSASSRTGVRRNRVFDSLKLIRIPSEIGRQASELRGRADEAHITRLPVSCVLAFPDLDEAPLKRLGARDRDLPILTRSDLSEGRLTASLRSILGGDPVRPLNEREADRARAVVNPAIKLPRRAETLPLFQEPDIRPESVIRVMDREQERVAEHLGDGYRLLRGVAGSGKTLVIAHRARHLHRHWPKWRILVLCYNRVLAEALKTMVDSDERLEVINIDRLAYRLAPPSRASKPPDFFAIAREAVVKASSLPDSERFDAVLVDEAQDFDHVRLNLAYAMLKSDRLKPSMVEPDRDNFVMAFDVAQNVYRRGGTGWNPPGVDAQGRKRTARGRSTVFRRNYRNTREILEFAMNFLSGSTGWSTASVDLEDPNALVPPQAAKRTGPQPRLTVCPDLRAEAEHIASLVAKLRDSGVDLHDVVVMYGHASLQHELWQSFRQRDLPYFHVQQKARYDGRDPRDRAVHVSDRVRVSTLTGMKGLEFSRAIIGGVNDIKIPDLDPDDQHQAAKSRLYAAMTRAMDELEITMSGDGSIGQALQQAERLQRVGEPTSAFGS